MPSSPDRKSAAGPSGGPPRATLRTFAVFLAVSFFFLGWLPTDVAFGSPKDVTVGFFDLALVALGAVAIAVYLAYVLLRLAERGA